MQQYQYVIIGQPRDMVSQNLLALLAEGWRPVRETSDGNGRWLVLLQKD